jgi:hypothetical protein
VSLDVPPTGVCPVQQGQLNFPHDSLGAENPRIEHKLSKWYNTYTESTIKMNKYRISVRHRRNCTIYTMKQHLVTTDGRRNLATRKRTEAATRVHCLSYYCRMSRPTVIKINWPRDVTETSQQEQFVLGSLGTAARRRCRLVHLKLFQQLAASRSLP